VALAEEDGCGVDVLAEASDLRAKASGKVRREGGEPFDGGVDSGEEGGISVERLWGCGLRSRSSASRRMTTFRSGWVEAGTVEVVGDVEGAGGGVAEAGRDLGFLEAEADAGELDVGERAAGCGGWGCSG
jgi:hypothetical protein